MIIDHVITSARIFTQLMETLHPYRVFMVRVTCSPAELERRETARKNRCPGSASASSQYLYPKEGYALTVDTIQNSSETCASRIAALLYEIPPGKY